MDPDLGTAPYRMPWQLTEGQDKLYREVSEEDPRFSENQSTKLSDSSLGEFGQVMDSVFNPLRKKSLLSKVYASFLKCDEDKISHTAKRFALYRSPLVRYALTKMKGYNFQKLELEGENRRVIEGGDKDLEVVQTGPDSHVKIPTYFNYGVIDKKDRKFCFNTEAKWNGLFLHLYYDSEAKGAEEAIDDFLSSLAKTVEKNNYFKGARINPQGQFLKLSKKTWKDVEIPNTIKNQIQNHIINMIEKEAIYEKNGISSKRGLLFAGRPGTGKTLVCKILASELEEFTFIWVTANDLKGAEDVEMVYTMARELAPTIVLLEDADLFCMDRRSGSTQPILGEILSQLDGLVELKRVVTIMTSNQPGVLDKALLERPGRFDVQIVFDPPEKDARRRILQKALGKVKTDKKDIAEVAEESDGLTGAQLKEVSNLAIIYAINEDSLDPGQKAIIKRAHLFKALQSYINSKARMPDSDPEIKTKKSEDYDSPMEYEVPSTKVAASYLDHKEGEGEIIEEQVSEKPRCRSKISGAVNKIIRR